VTALKDVLTLGEEFEKSKKPEHNLFCWRKLGTKSWTLGIAPHPTDKEKTILATVAYASRFFGLSPSSEACAERDRIVWSLEGKLSRQAGLKKTVQFHLEEGYDDPLSKVVYEEYALKPTQTKLALAKKLFKRVRGFQFYLAVGLIVLMFSLLALWYYQPIRFEEQNLLETEVIVLLTLVIDVGSALHDAWTKGRA
jgi:hypothetical protein